ncbi:hypothetical protein AALK94_15430 [Bacteroides faecichinchillae]|uniref:hypothetical protein n=1 Tax=Bacteroides faecichinchillae TaxID=871325 RepID=UPI0035161BAE
MKYVHCRLEERDEKGIINYVYYSNLWGDDATLKEQNAKKGIIGIPALDIRQEIRQLRACTTTVRFLNVCSGTVFLIMHQRRQGILF